MAVNLSPVGGVAAQFFTNSGAVLTGGKLYTYAAGTTTPQATYTTSQGNVPWTNPIVLDAAGRVPSGGEIWLTDGLIYKFLLKDSNDVLIATYDNITGINSNAVAYTNQQEIVTATAGQTVFNLGISYQPGTNSLSVFVDGVNQYGPGALYSYVETDENTVTFNSGLHVGAEVKFTTTQQQGAGAVDASQVSYDPPFTGSATTNVEAKLAQIVNVLDFVPSGEHAAILNGTSTYDISNAVRRAIDSLGPNGGVVNFPNGGAAKISSTVYIPPKGYGVALQGNKFAITGSGVDTHSIFETGMPGNSYGGSSNWSAPNESVLNQGLVIRDFVFLECGTAIKVFNAVWRSEFSGNWAYQNVTTLIHAKRCFYSKTIFNHAIIGRAGRAATDPCYWFEEAVNVQTIVGNSASGIYGGSNKSGTGYLFSGGLSGISISNNSAEACVTGLKVTGEITGAEIVGCYFELDTVGIDLGSAGKTVDIGGCFFYSNVTTAITCAGGWIAGTLRADNSINAACIVDLNASSNIMVVELAPQQLNMATAYNNYYNVPTNWTINPGARILRPAAVYDVGTGVAAQRALLTQETNSGGLTPLPYVGDIGPSMGAIAPFGYAVINAGTSVLVDTQITYRINAIAAFTCIVTDNSSTQRKIAGFVRFGTTVFRLDSVTATVTASNSAGKLRLTFSGFASTPLASIDDIRVWIG